MSNQPIRVFIADDFSVIRQVMHVLLSAAEDISIVGEAPDLDDALEEALALEPDVILMNDYLPPLDSAYAARLFRKRGLTCPILIVSLETTPANVRQSLEHGANGFIDKSEMGAYLIEAIRQVLTGRTYLSPMVERVVGSRES